MSSEAVPIPELIRRHVGLLAHFHANDPNKQGPGFGELDFVPDLRRAGRSATTRGWVSVEVFDYSPGIERLASESIENMQPRAGRRISNGSRAANMPPATAITPTAAFNSARCWAVPTRRSQFS